MAHTTSFVGGDCYYIEIQDSLQDRSLNDRWHRQYHPNNFPSGTLGLDFTDTNFGQPPRDPVFGTALGNYEDGVRGFSQNWATAASKFRNFHGLKCYCPGPHEAVLVPTPAFDAPGHQEIVPPCPLTAQLYFHTTPPSSAIDYWYYDLPRYADWDASLATYAEAFVEIFNGAAKPIVGDCSWEAVAIPNDQDVTWFVDRVKAWFGVT